MAADRLSMRQVKEILRQKWALSRSHREIAQSVGVSAGAVSAAVSRATSTGLTWSQVETLSAEALEVRLYGARDGQRCDRARPDCAYLHAERAKPGVTLELLHLEYLEKHPGGLRYTQFCDDYRRWLRTHRLSMRQVHRAGEKLFVDYSGKRPHIVDRDTGEVVDVELFVAVLGASSYTYAEATRTQKIHDWIGSHVRCLAFLGGVPRDLVPDQLKSGVTGACRYEPTIQRTYEEMAHHYGTTVLPARPAHPRDKAKVERAVQVVQRWILARLRHRTFFSLDELNVAIAELVDELNARTMRTYGASRDALFERLDKPALRPLPDTGFTCGEWKKVTVNIDYHVDYDGHYYSVPFTRVGETLWARATAATVEIYEGEERREDKRIDSYPRSYERGRHTTRTEHMPKAHQSHAEWTPSRFLGWAAKIGPETAKLVEAILVERPHPEQGYRSCLGILRLSKRYGQDRLEAACARAVAVRARSYRHVDSILRRGLDRLPRPGGGSATDPTPAPPHANIRGRGYYQ
ncbi:MAG: IS21 family transposase [Polyangiaceae bacterium]